MIESLSSSGSRLVEYQEGTRRFLVTSGMIRERPWLIDRKKKL
jgi:hypothetical protein